jgi:hypothetical protein
MQKEKLLNLLSKKDQSVEKTTEEPNNYSQGDLHKFIGRLGFDVEGTPKLSELAKLLNPQTQVLDEKPELQGQDNKHHLSMVREHLSRQKGEIDPQDKQLSVEALKKLIAKYKGER